MYPCLIGLPTYTEWKGKEKKELAYIHVHMYIRIRIRIHIHIHIHIRTPRDAFIHSFDTSTEDLLASNSDFEEMLRGDPAHSRSAIVLYTCTTHGCSWFYNCKSSKKAQAMYVQCSEKSGINSNGETALHAEIDIAYFFFTFPSSG